MIFINMISLKKLIIEGRYDSLITSLSNKLLSIIKDSYSATKDIEGQFSGAKIYEKFTINSEILPPGYPAVLNFVIKGLTHNISGGGWVTNIESLTLAR